MQVSLTSHRVTRLRRRNTFPSFCHQHFLFCHKSAEEYIQEPRVIQSHLFVTNMDRAHVLHGSTGFLGQWTVQPSRNFVVGSCKKMHFSTHKQTHRQRPRTLLLIWTISKKAIVTVVYELSSPLITIGLHWITACEAWNGLLEVIDFWFRCLLTSPMLILHSLVFEGSLNGLL